MIPAFHLDVNTLLASETLISVMFALVLFIMARRFGEAHGALRLGQAFIASAIGTFFFLLSHGLPLVVSVMVVNSLLMFANLLFYAGVDEILQVKPKLHYPAIVAVLSAFPVFWFTVVDNQVGMRIAVLSLADCLMQVWLAIDLFRCRDRGPVIYFLGATVMVAMIGDVLRAAAIGFAASAVPFLHHPVAQAVYMLTGLLASCALGLLSLMLVTSGIMDAIENSARRDPLTNVLNRRGIEDLLKTELDRAKRLGTNLCVALTDIDNFKTINDTWGHPMGDRIICDIADSICSNLRSYDACGRIGGDEFMMVLPSAEAEKAQQICERILQNVAALPPRQNVGVAPTISVGVTEYDSSDSIESLVARADRALYAAKREGRNRVRTNMPQFRVPKREAPVVDPGQKPSRKRPKLVPPAAREKTPWRVRAS
jgi:diguanylate cyclase (GGDEF)-like protein